VQYHSAQPFHPPLEGGCRWTPRNTERGGDVSASACELRLGGVEMEKARARDRDKGRRGQRTPDFALGKLADI